MHKERGKVMFEKDCIFIFIILILVLNLQKQTESSIHIYRNWPMWLWRLEKSHDLSPASRRLRKVSGIVLVQMQRSENWESQWYTSQSVGRQEKTGASAQADRQREHMLPLLPFCPIMALKLPKHVREGNVLNSVYWLKCESHQETVTGTPRLYNDWSNTWTLFDPVKLQAKLTITALLSKSFSFFFLIAEKFSWRKIWPPQNPGVYVAMWKRLLFEFLSLPSKYLKKKLIHPL